MNSGRISRWWEGGVIAIPRNAKEIGSQHHIDKLGPAHATQGRCFKGEIEILRQW